MLNNTKTKIVEWTLFFVLCIIATYFMRGVMEKYFSEKTSFTQTEKLMEELPTIVFCFSNKYSTSTKYEYGSDFKLSYVLWFGFESHNIFLKEDKNSTLLKEIVHLEKMRGYFGNCFKVTTILTQMQCIKQYTYSSFWLYFNETLIDKDMPVLKVHFTSAKNAYGVVRIMWKDGKAAKNQIERGKYSARI